MYIGPPNIDRFPAGYYRNYTINIAGGTLNWRISSFYNDSGDLISNDFRFRTQYSLSQSGYSQYPTMDSFTLSQCPPPIFVTITAQKRSRR